MLYTISKYLFSKSMAYKYYIAFILHAHTFIFTNFNILSEFVFQLMRPAKAKATEVNKCFETINDIMMTSFQESTPTIQISFSPLEKTLKTEIARVIKNVNLPLIKHKRLENVSVQICK